MSKCTLYILNQALTPIFQLFQSDNSRKSVRWSAVPVPCLSRLWLKLRGEQGSGPEGVDDLCFHTYGGFSPSSSPPPPSSFTYPPSPSHEAHISASRPISQPRDPYPSLEAHIPASRPISQTWLHYQVKNPGKSSYGKNLLDAVVHYNGSHV